MERYTELEKELAGSAETAQELGEKLAEREGEVTRLRDRLEEMVRREDELSGKLDSLRESTDSIQEHTQELEELREQEAAEATKLREKIAELTQQLEESSLQSLQEREDPAAELQAELKEHKERIRGLNDKLADLDSQKVLVVDLQRELASSQQETASLATRLQDSKETCKRLEDSLFERARTTSKEASPPSSQRSSEEVTSEPGSPLDKMRGMSIKAIQQQRVFQLSSQLQELEQRNQNTASRLKDAILAKEELQARLSDLEAVKVSEAPPQSEDSKQKSPSSSSGGAQEVAQLRQEVAHLAEEASRFLPAHQRNNNYL